MTFSEKINLICRIDQLIRLKATGNPRDLASRLSISESSVYRYINELKNLGAEIEFSNERESYYYKENFGLFA